MKRIVSGICTTLLAVGVVGATGAPAYAQVSGPESFDGKLVVHSDAAGNRTVLASVVRMDGVFKGVGQVVERDNLPGDPGDVNRDDLVFRQGTLHLLNTQTSFDVT